MLVGVQGVFGHEMYNKYTQLRLNYTNIGKTLNLGGWDPQE